MSFLRIVRWSPLLALLACLGCVSNGVQEEGRSGDTLALRHSSLLTIVERDSFTTVSIADAWHEGQVLHRYVLVPRDAPLPSLLPEGTLVRTPLRRATVFSSVHAALLQSFGKVNAISGMCDMEYIVSPALRRAMEAEGIPSVGASMQPDVERIVRSESDALLVSPFKDNSYGPLEKLRLPLIECADYMETSALGRAEWMRFYGRLFGFAAAADSVFLSLEARYEALAAKARNATPHPRLLIDRRENGTWFVPGGKSTLAQVYRDAGMEYLFADNEESGGVSRSMETMIAQGAKADIWLIKYGAATDLTLDDLARDDARYRRFRPWLLGKVYGCNTFRIPYYEEVPFRPDILLDELIRLAHPSLLPPIKRRLFYTRLSPSPIGEEQ